MKTMKYIILSCLLLTSINTLAQKSYINLCCYYGEPSYEEYDIYLSGDIPSGIDKKYRGESIGKLLNILSSKGYTVEFMSGVSRSSNTGYLVYLLSKNTTYSSTRISSVPSDDKEVVEIARYNLQGMPVYQSDKGIQIIVYSNYTTKTVIVE